MHVVLIACLLTLANCAKPTCTAPHSTFYTEHQPIDQSVYFIAATAFGAYHDDDPCRVVTNGEFRAEMVIHGVLSGDWHVDHIVDTANGPDELSICNKNILANLIMAAPKWNQGVGNLCWEYVAREKAEVYGAPFENAMFAVRSCCGLAPTPTFTGTTLIIGLVAISIVFVGCIVASAINNRRDQIALHADDIPLTQPDHWDEEAREHM